MKRKLLVAALSAAALFSTAANAQVPGVSKVTKILPEVDLGVKVGANFQQITGEGWEKTYKPGIVGGAFVGLRKGSWGVQAEGLIKTVKFSPSFTGGVPIKALYLDIPVLLEYRIIPRLWAQVGPQFSYMLSKDNSVMEYNTAFKTSDFSGLLGLEAKLPLHLTAGARYVLGLTDINNHTLPSTVPGATDAWKNRYIQVYVGFRFL
jgi:opacity protein-like surface antigen